ncbi:hypothetical protein D3C79_628720 [compost metagenome]
MRFVYASPLVINDDGKAFAAASYRQQQRAMRRIFEAVGQYVLHHGRQHATVGARPVRAGPQAYLHPGPAGGLGVLTYQLRQKSGQGECLAARLHAPVVQGVKVENRAKKLRYIEQRAVDAVHQSPLLFAQLRLAQACREQADRVNRLAQVVAGLGQEAGFLAVGRSGLFRGLARALQQQVRIHRDDRAGGKQHQHHERVGLPVRRDLVHHQQRRQRQHRGNRQVARAEAHAVAQVHPHHHRIDRQRRLATYHQAEAGTGVVMHHPQYPSPRVIPGPTGNGLAQTDGHQHKGDDVVDDRQIRRKRAARQKAQHGHVDQRTAGDDHAQVGLIEFVVLVQVHGQPPCARGRIAAIRRQHPFSEAAKLAWPSTLAATGSCQA